MFHFLTTKQVRLRNVTVADVSFNCTAGVGGDPAAVRARSLSFAARTAMSYFSDVLDVAVVNSRFVRNIDECVHYFDRPPADFNMAGKSRRRGVCTTCFSTVRACFKGFEGEVRVHVNTILPV